MQVFLFSIILLHLHLKEIRLFSQYVVAWIYLSSYFASSFTYFCDGWQTWHGFTS